MLLRNFVQLKNTLKYIYFDHGEQFIAEMSFFYVYCFVK